MATRYWLSTSSDLTAAGAWSGGAAPVNGDTVIFPATASLAPASNLTGLSAVTVAIWYVEDGCPISFGSSGLGLQVGATELVFFGAGDFYFNNATAANTATLLIAPTNPNSMIQLSGNAADNTWIVNGTVEIATSFGNNFAVWVSPVMANDRPKLHVSAAASVTQLIMNGGDVLNESSAQMNAAWPMGGSLKIAGSGGAQFIHQMGGTVDYQSSGTLDFAYIMRGLFDLSQGSQTRTVTELHVHPGARYRRDPNVATVTNEYILLDEVGLATQ